ncbi:LacI family DNA-binding transcriptional regulator [Glaciibacter superstes]|uniref:LacI family DNA-binding transcriptional regulator n=1 Tax=Glaciibacter superstes TaxID=501023 RepID=UPI0003B6C061|nr:LacI family DNA-binding transcriptional regulator [Glaciibacter superstes]
MATIREVADKAGVAPASVTRVLGGYPNVSDELRERVLTAVREVGYEPDLVAAGLRRGYTKTIGMIVNDILNPVVAQMVDVVEDELRVAGYGVILANSNGQSAHDLVNLRLLHQRRVDGLIASVADDTNPDLIATMAGLPIPVVLLDRQIELENLSAVLSDHRYSARALANHLIDHGHRQIAIISGATSAYPSRERVTGVLDVMRERGLPVRPEFQVSGRGSEEFASRSLSSIMDQPEPPTAIIIGNGNTAALVGVLHELRRRGVQIGVDIAIAAAEDGPLVSLYTPAITAVERDIIDLGRRAARMVLAQLAKDTLRAQTIVLPTRLVIRESTDWTLPAPALH